MPGLMTFSATLRWTGSLLLGHPDQAHAAFADLLHQLVGADDVPGPRRPNVRPFQPRRAREIPENCRRGSWRPERSTSTRSPDRRHRRCPGIPGALPGDWISSAFRKSSFAFGFQFVMEGVRWGNGPLTSQCEKRGPAAPKKSWDGHSWPSSKKQRPGKAVLRDTFCKRRSTRVAGTATPGRAPSGGPRRRD